MITLYLRYTFPPPRHEFNSRREIDGYESVRSSGKIVLFCFHTLFRLDYRFFFFFSPFFFFSRKSIYLSIHLFIYLSRPFFIPHHRRKLSMIHLSAELISFQSLPPSSSLVGVFLFRGAAVSPTSILKIARIIRRIPRSNVIIVINPVVLSNE